MHLFRIENECDLQEKSKDYIFCLKYCQGQTLKKEKTLVIHADFETILE